MRLWSLHPRYLDSKGLVAAWREALLAQKVLAGKTKGYRHHPQLARFKKTKNPLAKMGTYLSFLAEEASERGYEFDAAKILKKSRGPLPSMPVTRGQLRYEAGHLLNKLKVRDPERFRKFKRTAFRPHPLFYPVRGSVEEWEIRKRSPTSI